jgi:hypothetical protein
MILRVADPAGIFAAVGFKQCQDGRGSSQCIFRRYRMRRLFHEDR